MNKLLFLAKLMVVVLIFAASFNLNEVKAAPPTVTFLINGGTQDLNMTGSNGYGYTVNLSWSSNGARCEASGSGQAGWGYDPDLQPSGNRNGVLANSKGISNFILTCFSSSGEKTTVMRTSYAGYYGPDCGVFPEHTGAGGYLQVTNKTRGGSSSVSFGNNSSDWGPELPAAIGDSLEISYGGDVQASEGQVYISGPNFRYGNSTSSQAYMDAGTLIVDSLNAIGTIGLSASSCGGGYSSSGLIQLVPVQSNPNFSLSLSPSSRAISQGGATTYDITSTCIGGFSGPITSLAATHGFSGLTISAPSSLGCGATGIINVTASGSASPTGSASGIIISGTGSGVGSRNSNSVSLTINGPGQDFSLSIDSPTLKQTTKGGNLSYTLRANCYNGFSGPINNLRVDTANTQLSGATISFGSSSIACGGTTTLSVTNTNNVPQNQLSTPQNIQNKLVRVLGDGVITTANTYGVEVGGEDKDNKDGGKK